MNDGFASECVAVSLEEEMQKSYLSYSMSVIIGRALPDVRDGLKPVHRRVLFAMHELKNYSDKPYKKSARIVGDVIGKYHPHGDIAVYGTIVRMAQPFSLRYPLIDGQGNFGSVDGDGAAAMRYTEVRMSRISKELLEDLEKGTVDFRSNYDGSEVEPVVLPSKIPNLLINGSEGIAVGMATKIPPHNLEEIVDALIHLIKKPESSTVELLEFVKAPDFPTGGIIYGLSGVIRAYKTGHGRCVIRAKTHVEISKEGKFIVIDELPYQVNKSELIRKIADLVTDKTIEGIVTARDESDKSGMRVVIELKSSSMERVVLNQLFKLTNMQVSFGMNMVALVNGQPRQLSLKEFLYHFIRHRREVIVRRTKFDLEQAKKREITLLAYAIAFSNLNEFIEIIKSSQNSSEAKAKLTSNKWKSDVVDSLKGTDNGVYILSESQADAILRLRLVKLTTLAKEEILDEYKNLLVFISDLSGILSDVSKVDKIICDDLDELKGNYDTERRSIVEMDDVEISDEDLISNESKVIILTRGGYVKAMPISEFQVQNRGGKGKIATRTKEEDQIEKFFTANSHDFLLCFSTAGRLYWLRAYQLPSGSRNSKGKSVVNLLPLDENERLTSILAVPNFEDAKQIVMATSSGLIKKMALSNFSKPRHNGTNAFNLGSEDRLIGAILAEESSHIMLFSDAGKAVRFEVSSLREVKGKATSGVRGMKLNNSSLITILVVNSEEDLVFTATENGFGKLSKVSSYRQSSRGIAGVIAINTGERNGKMIGATVLSSLDDLMLITDKANLVRISATQIPEVGRAAAGVKLIDLKSDGGKLLAIAAIAGEEIDHQETNSEHE